MKPALEKFLIIAATLAAIGLFIFVALWNSMKEKKTQMDDLFNNTNVPTSYFYGSGPGADGGNVRLIVGLPHIRSSGGELSG
ncbi:hypothetical protein [Paenibacillus hamazuiensis]|uniref:hypothetical protein n=1 Tax=Paenibacillus hamazuiensis TaxID=2936508 RepID=UPI00200D052F|nr:hypothetical protein [Paenibacillus hamazuiensis]